MFALRVVANDRGCLFNDGYPLMTVRIRPVVALALGLLVAACGGGTFLPNAVRSPNAPSMLHAELTPNNDVVLTWEAPTPSDDRAPVTGYRVYVQHADGRTEEHSPDTPSLSYRPVGLSSGTRYVFFVRALSERGLSEPSSSAFVDVPAVSVAPIAVPHLTVRADEGALRTLISWNHRAPEPPIVVTGFNLQYCEVTHGYDSDHCPNTDGWIPIGDLEMSATTREFIDEFDCSASSPRMYRIQALARVGSGPDEISSRYSDITPPICPSATYSPPRRVDAVFDANPVRTRVNICWEVPEHNGGPVDGYELQVTPDDVLPATEDDWLTVDAHIRLGALPVCILYAGLAENDARWFRVRAYNLAGHGHWSAPYHYVHDTSHLPPLPSRSSALTTSAFSVGDTRAREGEDAELVFEVTLDQASSVSVTVNYTTADGTAKAGEDYRAASGTLELAPGETSKTIEVAVLDDPANEDEETLSVHLFDATGAGIADGEATGTIENNDPMPNAWLARLGRTVAGQLVSTVGARLERGRSSHVTLGGMLLGFSEPGGIPEALGRGASAPPPPDAWTERPRGSRSHVGQDRLRGNSFHLASEGGGPTFAAWGGSR